MSLLDAPGLRSMTLDQLWNEIASNERRNALLRTEIERRILDRRTDAPVNDTVVRGIDAFKTGASRVSRRS